MMLRLLLWATFMLLSRSETVEVDAEGTTTKPPFPDRTTTPIFAESRLEVVATLPNVPGNVDVEEATGRIFFTFHPAAEPTEGKVAEWHTDEGKYTHFPDEATQKQFITILALRVDNANHLLYALDWANHGAGRPSIWAFDLASSQKGALQYHFPADVAGPGSMLNDFVVSPDGRYLYVADCNIVGASPAIIIVDTQMWTSWRVLEKHPSVLAKSVLPYVNGNALDLPWNVGVDSIALSPNGSVLYFASIYDDILHSIPTDKLHDPLLPGLEVEAAVESTIEKTISDGIVMDSSGNMYVTDFEHSSIARISGVGTGTTVVETLVHSQKLLRWPDGVSISNGYLYVSCSAIHEIVSGNHMNNAPFHILRIKL